jgi:hypothetical protein
MAFTSKLLHTAAISSSNALEVLMLRKHVSNGQSEVSHMGEYYHLLEQIREKPSLYIGAPSISNLFMFLQGYHFARQQLHAPMSAQVREFQEFQPWLQKRLGVKTSRSWSQLILCYATDERDAFARFFELFHEFLQSKDQQPAVQPVDSKLELA